MLFFGFGDRGDPGRAVRAFSYQLSAIRHQVELLLMADG